MVGLLQKLKTGFQGFEQNPEFCMHGTDMVKINYETYMSHNIKQELYLNCVLFFFTKGLTSKKPKIVTFSITSL